MKSIFAAMGFALATTAMPAIAVSQESAAEQAIVVAGKYQSGWSKGSKLEAEGLMAHKEAKKDLIRYSADVVEARNARDAAQARSQNARVEFHSLVSQAMTISDPDRARDYGQNIKKFAEEWENFNDRVRSAEKDLDKASKKQRKAQAAVEKARAKVDRGQAMMTEAELLSRARN
ncbi:MAG: hypothetical protein KKB61_11275 [Alphaproteobacteria bacterium]|nr:hypothetical protein [Alphaproteobacteria bacterium]